MHLKKLKLRVDLVLSNIAFESLNIHFPSVKDFPSPPFLKRKEKSFSLTSWQLSASKTCLGTYVCLSFCREANNSSLSLQVP